VDVGALCQNYNKGEGTEGFRILASDNSGVREFKIGSGSHVYSAPDDDRPMIKNES